MPDKYDSFRQLSTSEREGVDFRVVCRVNKSSTVIVAPHGGSIEPGTSEIADAMAADDFSFYAFEGLKPRHNSDLHITSSHFDEPRCIAVVQSSSHVVTVHGEESKRKAVFLGGRDTETLGRLCRLLQYRGFVVLRHEEPGLQGLDPSNLCNRGRSKVGVQLEVALGLRQAFFSSLGRAGRKHTTPRFWEFVAAVRESLA